MKKMKKKIVRLKEDVGTTAPPANQTGAIAQLGQVMNVGKRNQPYYEQPPVKIDEPKLRLKPDFEGWTVVSLSDLQKIRQTSMLGVRQESQEKDGARLDEKKSSVKKVVASQKKQAKGEKEEPSGEVNTLGDALKVVDSLVKDYKPGTENNSPQMTGRTLEDKFASHLTARRAVALGDQVRLVRTNDIAYVKGIDLDSGSIVVQVHNAPETINVTASDLELMQPIQLEAKMMTKPKLDKSVNHKMVPVIVKKKKKK